MDVHPIDQLLCDCLGRVSNNVFSENITHISSIDWNELFRRSQELNVMSLCYARIKELSIGKSVPPNTLDELKKEYLHTIYLNTMAIHNLSKVLLAFKQANIEVIPLKGCYLIENIYNNIALRFMGDADLLVHKNDLNQVRNVLLELGYTAGPYWLEAVDEQTHALPPFSKPNAVNLDVHWTFENPGNPFNFDMNAVWERSIPSKIADVDVLSLSPEDFLLHLCLHTAYHHHFTTGLRSICDISKTITCYAKIINWDLLIFRTKEWHAEKSVFLALHITETLIGLSIPTSLLNQLRPADFNSSIEAWALKQIFPHNELRPHLPVKIVKTWSKSNFLEKLTMLLNFVFPSRSFMSIRYKIAPNSKFLSWYYFRRIFELPIQHGPNIWFLFKGDETALQINQREIDGLDLVNWLSNK